MRRSMLARVLVALGGALAAQTPPAQTPGPVPPPILVHTAGLTGTVVRSDNNKPTYGKPKATAAAPSVAGTTMKGMLSRTITVLPY